MHYFLTGDIQVGKSTLIQKVLKQMEGIKIGGFRTIKVDDRTDAVGSVYIVDATEPSPACSKENLVGLRLGNKRGRIGYPNVFDQAGIALLDQAEDDQLILMDEIGRMEAQASDFSERIKELLGQNTPILGVVQKAGNTPLLDAIRQHPNVALIEVTEENRDQLADELYEKVCFEIYKTIDSAGAIIFRRKPEGLQVLMLYLSKKGWSFPKGHVEYRETRMQAAYREVKEETGLEVKMLPDFCTRTTSGLATEQRNIYYFIGECTDDSFCPGEGEDALPQWQPADQAEQLLRFEQDKKPFCEALAYYRNFVMPETPLG